MKSREFITVIVARRRGRSRRGPPGMAVIGFLSGQLPSAFRPSLGRISPGPEADRLYRGPQCRD